VSNPSYGVAASQGTDGLAVTRPDGSTDRRTGRTEADTWSWWRWGPWLGLAFVALAGVAVAWVSFGGDRGFAELPCRSTPSEPRVGCIASMPVRDIAVRITNTVSLTPDGNMLLLGGEPRSSGTVARDTPAVLAALNIVEKREAWRVPLDEFASDIANVAVAADGTKAAVWGSLISIRAVPGGAKLADISIQTPYTEPHYDVAFSDDGATVTTGIAGQRRTYQVAVPAAEPAFAPATDDKCWGLVGQSNIGSVRSRDGRAVVLLLSNWGSAQLRVGEFSESKRLSEVVCGTSSVALLDSPEGWSTLFASFSPRNDRLAIVHGADLGGKGRTLIEIWDSGQSLKRVAAFPIRGRVGYRIGWSHNARRFAAIRSVDDHDDAMIFALP
jgi:hypothetical protein